jgi:demethylmenaquinone methyltransferase/2-methoxy-6-polyprenyl-1,4-benzoquinol methylase
MTGSIGLLTEQLEYYRARAAEYDQWWLRQGRYDRGPALNGQWFSEAAEVRSALQAFRPHGRILELACGTGIWTEQLAPYARRLTAVDGSAEMLAINAARVQSPGVSYVQADLFEWQPSSAEQYDIIFFGFWLSHVPPERFADFWRLVGACLAPGGRVFFVDSRRQETSTALDHTLPDPSATILQRRLNDGRAFRVYKIFYDPIGLTARLQQLGWEFTITETEHYFLYGFGSRASS